MKRISLLVGLLIPFAIYAQPNPAPKSKHAFVVIAHRGDHITYPENTLEAYQAAIDHGADFIEVDVRATKDGKLVSVHDATINRMTTGKGAVKDLTLAEIQAFEVKSKDTTRMYKVPTFEQILKLAKNKINLYIDFKEADPEMVYHILKGYKMDKHALVYINKAEQLTGWRKAEPLMPLMLSLPDTVKTTAGMQAFIDKYHPDMLDGDYRQYTPEMLALAAKLQLTSWPDVQSANEGPDTWNKALSQGFKGVQTDHPEALILFLKEKGVRP